MASIMRLEDLYNIMENSYTTGSEWFDGLIIGLATLLLVRNGEFVMLDILTYFFGEKRHRTGFRVLRLWQMLNAKHFYHLITGFDSDIPYSLLRRSEHGQRSCLSISSRCKIKKGKFASLLFVSVLLGKLLILGTEVAIIAFVIPVARIHKSDGGIGFKWKNATITEASLASMSTCQPMLTSDVLSDSAQLALCKRLDVRDSSNPLPPRWKTNGSLRMEQILLTHDRAKQIGGRVTENEIVFCREQSGSRVPGSVARFFSPEVNRQVGSQVEPKAEFINSIEVGEIRIRGYATMGQDGDFHSSGAAVLPVFSDAQKTLRLSFSKFFAEGWASIGGNGIVINGKLFFGRVGSVPGQHSISICRDALDEIIRVTGSLHPGLILDLFRSSMTVETRAKFSEPSPSLRFLNTVEGFEIGTSRRFRIEPEWMIMAAALMIILSSLTSCLNRTELRVARVYREHNNMWSAASPTFLDEEHVAEGALFRRENEYHWGESPGEEWEPLPKYELFADGVLV